MVRVRGREEGGRRRAAAQAAKLLARRRNEGARPRRSPEGCQEAAALEKRRTQVAAWYQDPSGRRRLVAERETLDDLAFASASANTTSTIPRPGAPSAGASLSRAPPARDRLMDLAARSCAARRPLPITSLVRTEQYQRQLGETNRTRRASPSRRTRPASLYDVYYHYMTGPEQDAR